MRLVLLAAAVAVAGVIGLLVYDRRQQRPRTPDTHSDVDPRPDPPPDRVGPPLPGINGQSSQEDLASFVSIAAARGPEAVAHLLHLLRSGEDAELLPRWRFKESELEGYPSLRSACIEALRAIEGPEADAALREVVGTATSAEEAYLAALALRERGLTGWSGPFLEQAGKESGPGHHGTRRAMVALVAKHDPVATADYIVANAPRGEDKSVPRVLAEGLKAMPIENASATMGPLLANPEVTPRAKVTYARAFVARKEIEAFSRLRSLAEQGAMDERTSLDVAYAMAQSNSFRLDAIDHHRAKATGDAAAAAEARDRFEQRMDEVYRYVSAALSLDLHTTKDKRGAALRRHLEGHRKAFGPR